MKTITLSNGENALVDDTDFEALSQWRWNRTSRKGYPARSARITVEDIKKQTTVYMHRQLMAPPFDMTVDHINGNVLDNQRSNLRVCTRQQNEYNKGVGVRNKSGFRGVSVSNKTGKWIVVVRVEGKTQYFGQYNSAEEAAKEYDRVAIIHHGEFAHLNFQRSKADELV